MNVPLTHSHRGADQSSETLPTQHGELPTVLNGPSTIISPGSITGDVTSKTSKGEVEVLKDLSVFCASFERFADISTQKHQKSRKSLAQTIGRAINVSKEPINNQ